MHDEVNLGYCYAVLQGLFIRFYLRDYFNMKKLLPTLLAIVASSSVAAYTDSTTSHASSPSKSVKSTKGEHIEIAPKKPTTTQVGFALEERSTPFADGYLFVNQMIHGRLYWELRGYYLHNYVVVAPPAGAVPRPLAKNEHGLNGTGVVGLFGYNFPISKNLTLLPYFRSQYFTNTISAYSDSLGNEITTGNTTYYLGLKLTMTVNEVLSIYGNLFAGYLRTTLDGKGFFATPTTPRINSTVSTYQIGLTYKATPSWSLTPYAQLNISNNRPNWVAIRPPINNSGLTTNSTLFGFRVAYTI